MIIRKEQMDLFESAASPHFETHMIRHLSQFAPLHSRLLGEGVRAIIQRGIERAKCYGMTTRGPVQFYIELTFLLGADFDTDPQYPWTARILADTTEPDQLLRADRLYGEVMAYLHAVGGGPRREFAKRALRRARGIPFEGIPLSSPRFQDETIQRMQEMYPEKCDYVGEQSLITLIPRVLEEARKYAVTSDAGIGLIGALMFTLGHGVITDPKYTFIESTLMNGAIPDPNTRAERLYSKIMTYLDNVLQQMDKS